MATAPEKPNDGLRQRLQLQEEEKDERRTATRREGDSDCKSCQCQCGCSQRKRDSSAREIWSAPPIIFRALGALLVALLLFSTFSSYFYSPPKALSPLQSPSAPPISQVTVEPDIISKMSSSEQTFIAIKPDGVQRGLIGPIISRFENRGFKLAAIKLVTPPRAHIEKHYEDLAGKPFFAGLVNYMLSGPICAMVWEGRDAVKTGRVILGATNPLASAPGTIRGDFAIDVGRNVCHGSDSVENAKKEIALWFGENEVVNWKQAAFDWIYEKA